jgi:hypothetical protein
MEQSNLTKTAISATLHCLTGCAIGEVLGMVISTAFGWDVAASILISVLLAFMFGYGLSAWSLMRHNLKPRQAIKIALAADTISIFSMEITDNLFLLLIPGALDAGLDTSLFWASLMLSLAVAFIITLPVNRYLIARGKGHAVVHQYHHHS